MDCVIVSKFNSPVPVTYPGGAIDEYQYDPLMRIKKILEYDPAQNLVMTREYEYSQGSNVLAKKTEHGDYSYGYDDLYRLKRETRPDFSDDRQLITDDYTYDAIGNRLTKTGIPGTWSYNANAELLGFGNTSFTYDANGNLTQKFAEDRQLVTDDYSYDVSDQLISVTRFTSAFHLSRFHTNTIPSAAVSGKRLTASGPILYTVTKVWPLNWIKTVL